MVTPELQALSDAIGRVLEDDDLRRDLQRRGRERGRSLRWSKNARQTLDVLRSVAMGSALQGEVS